MSTHLEMIYKVLNLQIELKVKIVICKHYYGMKNQTMLMVTNMLFKNCKKII
jgi:hypothetical protein